MASYYPATTKRLQDTYQHHNQTITTTKQSIIHKQKNHLLPT